MLANRVELAPADRKDNPFGRDSERDERIARGQSSVIRKSQVVDDVAALVGVAFNRYVHVGMGFEPFRVGR